MEFLKTIEICFCINDAYVKHCLSTILSIKSNLKSEYILSFNIITDYIEASKKDLIKKLEDKQNIKINIIEVNDEKYENINL
jgi:lipopolysaccharide biosynthesis glycosyltransferase